MLLNRRAMLTAGIGAVALSLSGCKSTKTTIIFVNGSSSKMSIHASAGGDTFTVNNLQPGHQSKKINNSNANLGTLVAMTGTATLATAPPFTVSLAGLVITAGYTNTITIFGFFPPPTVVVS